MKPLLVLLLALSLPLFLGIANVRLMATSPAFYEWGFRRHRIAAVTGLDEAQLRRVADDFIRYFNAPPGRLDVRVQRGGGEVPLFSEREIAHMVDVQALMRTLRSVWLVTGVAILVALVGLTWLERRPLGPDAGLGLLAGSGVTLGLLAVIGLASLADFSSFWTRFHLVAFSNDLWMLDPERDNLMRLFPPPFWLDATLLLAGATALEAILVGAVGLGAYLGIVGSRQPVAPASAARPH
jgi:integral membrane protein (TIGR01906 family)